MLITVAEAKSFLQITGTTYDTLITGYCGYITAEINTYIGRNIESATYTGEVLELSLIHISEPTRPCGTSRMPSSA